MSTIADPLSGTTADFGTTSHLQPGLFAAANRHLVRKAIAEFSHELILKPAALEPGHYELVSDDGSTSYRFEAQVLALEHWSIPAESIRCLRNGSPADVDALRFITEFAGSLGIGEEMLPVYLEEISSTLASHAYKHSADPLSAEELAQGVTAGADPAADFQAVERSMSEGHPCFVANNGRLGFGSSDYLAYAPETGAGVYLHWIAAAREHTRFDAVPGLDYTALLAAELDPPVLAGFEADLRSRGLDPEDYLLMPVHPWQWENKLSVTFAADVAAQRLVHLGPGPDRYQAQQSIRTFFNRDAPQRCYVKTALSVVNMGFMRGLSAEYMKATPAINEWVDGLVRSDSTLAGHGFSILKESAAMGYSNPYYQAAAPKGSPYRKMLAALWRESPLPQLQDGEQLATMASLLHTDAAGTPLVSALIRKSGLDARTWLTHYLRAYLVPVLHCFYKYRLAFMPHGENLILVLDNGLPARVLMKDIGEEVIVMADKVELPGDLSRIRVQVPAEEQVLSIFTDVFDCFLRFLAALLHEDGQLDQTAFWSTVGAVVSGYQAQHPELAADFAAHDLFAPDFARSCLNRLQLRNNQQMLDLSDPSGGLQFAGHLANPLGSGAKAAGVPGTGI